MEKSNKKFVVLESIGSGKRFWSINSYNNTHSQEGELWYKEIAFTNDEQEAIKLSRITSYLPNDTIEINNSSESLKLTLEQAAKRYAHIPLDRCIDEEERYFNHNCKYFDSFIAGANWKSQSEWIDVKTLPIKAGRYWCFISESTESMQASYQSSCFFNKEQKTFSFDNEIVNVTHWMDLPEKPIGK